uniref:RRM domain-containing protein n=1 Tax=Opuntia streptacantha TaxID=393608 RepID=A0A7C8YIX6_OPUST
MSQHILRSNDLCSSSIDPVTRDVSLLSSGVYGLGDLPGYGVRSEPITHELAAGISTRSYPSSLEDPIVTSQRRDLSARISPMPVVNPDLLYERPPSQQSVDGLPVSPGESNILFVDGLPTDCTRREVEWRQGHGSLLCRIH